jgi:hypothetical protein
MIVGLAAATGLFVISVIRARGHNVGTYGLLPLLGIWFLAAALLTVAVLVLALRFIRTAWPAAVGAICLLLVEFNGTQMMLDPTPLGSPTFKHFGVVDYLVHGGALSNPYDIYQQWPGFFAAAAGLVRLSGRSSLSYANWSQLFFVALNTIVLFAIARRFAPRHPIVPYVTILLFLTANWEGGQYYSPQTLAFELSLLFQFFLLSLLELERLRWPFRTLRWLKITSLETRDERRITAIGRAARSAGLVALFGAIIITHQLSPYIVFAGVAALWILGVLRHPLMMLSFIALLAAYLLLHLSAVEHDSVLNGFDFSNATGVKGFAVMSPAQAMGSNLSKVVCVGFWGATAVSGISYGRRFGVVLVPVILAVIPLSLILVSKYDGEGIFRVFLFSSPWSALVIAMRLAGLLGVPKLKWLVPLGLWAMFAALGSAQAALFGQYAFLQVPAGEIRASSYFLDHAPVNSTLVMAADDFPERVNARYVLHNATDSPNGPALDAYLQFDGNKLERMTPRALAQSVANLAKGSGYLVIAPSMEQYNQYYEIFTPGTLSSLSSRLRASIYWKVWYEDDGTVIFQPLPQGKPAGKEKQGHRP